MLAYRSHVKRMGSSLERFSYVAKPGPTALERLEAKKSAAAATSSKDDAVTADAVVTATIESTSALVSGKD